MSIRIRNLAGVSATMERKLKQRGITNSSQLLLGARTRADRQLLASTIGVDSKSVLEMANRADLARVKGIGAAFSDLLEHAGVDTVKELANRSPENLHARLVEINTQKRIAHRLPPLSAVEDWVSQAKRLPTALTY